MMTKNDKGFVSLWDLRDERPNDEILCTYEQVRGAFEHEHPHNMVDASDAYVLTVFPFGRDDEQPYDYETENWETGLYEGYPAMRRVADGRVMVAKEDETLCHISYTYV